MQHMEHEMIKLECKVQSVSNAGKNEYYCRLDPQHKVKYQLQIILYDLGDLPNALKLQDIPPI